MHSELHASMTKGIFDKNILSQRPQMRSRHMCAEPNDGEVRSPFRSDPVTLNPGSMPQGRPSLAGVTKHQQARQSGQQQTTADVHSQADISAAGQQQNHPRKKQKTEHASAQAAAVPATPVSDGVPVEVVATDQAADINRRSAPQQQARAPPPDRHSASAGLVTADRHQQRQQPGAPSTTVEEQQQQSAPEHASMPPPRSSLGASSMQGGQGAAPSAAHLPSWEAERLRIKQLRQDEKLRMK